MTYRLTNNDVMPWGKHKGTKLSEVPVDYKFWLLEQPWISQWRGLHRYLKKHEEEIRAEVAEQIEEKDETEGYDSYEDFERDFHGM